MGEWTRATGWLLAGAALAMVTDGFGTFSRPEPTPPLEAECPQPEVPPSPSPPPPTPTPADSKADAPAAYDGESMRQLQQQIGDLERLLSERRTRSRGPAEPVPQAQTPPSAEGRPTPIQMRALQDELLAQQGDLLSGGGEMKVDPETQRQVMQIVQDLKRQLDSGQLDRQRQIDEVMKSQP